MKLSNKIFFLLSFFTIIGVGLKEVSAQQENDTKIITNQDNAITVYPVPAKNVAHIRLSPSLVKNVDKIEIINIIGRKVTEQNIIDKNTTEVTFTNLNAQPAGIYMVITRDKYGKIIQSAKMIIDN